MVSLIPDYTDDGLDDYKDPREQQWWGDGGAYVYHDEWERDSDDDRERDVLNDLEEDLVEPTMTSNAEGLAEIRRSYETDNWQAEELSRDIYDDGGEDGW